MKKRLIILILIAGAMAAALGYLGSSTRGLLLSTRLAGRLLPGTLAVAAAQGSLAHTLHLAGITYHEPGLALAVGDLTLSWHPAALLHGTLDIAALEVNGVVLRPQPTPPAPPVPAWTGGTIPFLPVELRLHRLALHSLDLVPEGEGQAVHISAIKLGSAALSGSQLRFDGLDVAAPDYRVSGGGEVQTGPEVQGWLTVAGSFTPPGYAALGGRAILSGTLARLAVALEVQQPFRGTLRGSVTGLPQELHWQADLASKRVGLADISRDWPGFVLDNLKASGTGTLSDYTLQVESDAQYGSFRGIHLRTGVDGDADGLRLSATRIDRDDEEIRGYGILDWRDTFSWQGALTGKRLTLSRLDPSWPGAVLSDLSVNGHGVLDTYTLEVESGAAYGGLPGLKGQGIIAGNAEGLRFRDIRLNFLAGELRAAGQLGWEEAFTWQAAARGTGINPAGWQAQWPGCLNFQLSSSGSLRQNTLQGEIDIASLAGTLRTYPLQGRGKIVLDGSSLAIEDLALDSGQSHLRVNGRYAETVDMDAEFKSTDLASLWPGAGGSVRATGKLEGRPPHPSAQLTLAGNGLALNDLQAGHLDVAAQASLAPGGSLQARLQATNLILAGTPAEAFAAAIQGTGSAHRLQTNIRSGADSLRLELDGSLAGSSWQGTLVRADLQQHNFGTWHLAEPARMSVSARGATVADFCLAGPVSARFCLAGDVLPDALWQSEARIESLPLTMLPPGPFQPATLAGTVSGNISLSGDRTGLKNGVLALASDNAALTLAMPEHDRHRITWQGNTLRAELANARLTAGLRSTLQDGSTIISSLTMNDVRTVPQSLAQSQMEASVSFDIKEIQPLAILTYPTVDPHGALQGEISLAGTVRQPRLFGTAKILQGKMGIPPLGLAVEGLQLNLAGSGSLFKVTAAGNSGGGSLQAAGELVLGDLTEPKLSFHLRGERFAAVNLPDMKIYVSPDLQGTLTGKQGEITGTVVVPQAVIASQDFTAGVEPSADVVVVTPGNKPQQSGWPLSMQVAVIAGDDVRVDAFGLKGQVKGRLKIANMPGKPVTGDGVLTVADGTFSVYGRKLTIKSGRLLYNGNPLDNPGIDVRAENTANEVTTGVQVAGFLSEPDISFYSLPPMEESAIISRLLMNTSLLESSEQDQGFLGSVAARTGLDAITSKVRGVKEGLRLDEVKLETGKKSNELSLVIGTWLTPELYISYGKNLLKEAGSFNTRYLLGHGFSIQTETGVSQNGADLKYEIDR